MIRRKYVVYAINVPVGVLQRGIRDHICTKMNASNISGYVRRGYSRVYYQHLIVEIIADLDTQETVVTDILNSTHWQYHLLSQKLISAEERKFGFTILPDASRKVVRGNGSDPKYDYKPTNERHDDEQSQSSFGSIPTSEQSCSSDGNGSRSSEGKK